MDTEEITARSSQSSNRISARKTPRLTTTARSSAIVNDLLDSYREEDLGDMPFNASSYSGHPSPSALPIFVRHSPNAVAGSSGASKASRIEEDYELQTSSHCSDLTELMKAGPRRPHEMEPKKVISIVQHRLNLMYDQRVVQELDSISLERMGESLLRQGRLVDARNALQHALDVRDDCSPNVFCMTMECYIQLGNYRQAELVGHAYLEKYPRKPETYIANIDCHLHHKNQAAAIEVCSLAIQRFPKSPYFYDMRGQCYHALKEYKKSVADFHKSIELSRLASGMPTDMSASLKSWKRNSLL